MILVRAAAITDDDATLASDRGAGKPLMKFKGLGEPAMASGEVRCGVSWEVSYED